MTLHARNLTLSLGSKRVLDGVSFTARTGELTAIIGPNGCGKTTTLKVISGEIRKAGSVTLFGRPLEAYKPWELALRRGVLAQHTTIAFPFTVREIVGMGVTAGTGATSASAEEQAIERALAAVDLEGFAGRFYQDLSGGEQQRVQLARVLCQVSAPVRDGEPAFLFLDEPVSSLDIRHQLSIMALARRFADAGGGVIAILHDLNLTAMYADHVVMMRAGTVAAGGAPQAVFTDDTLQSVFGCTMRVGVAPPIGTPFILPQTAIH
ncbi:iron complex transport system ATP-binding protein [Rhizobium sp. RU20A]|uniref:heme ABC transporter ATP-binding protein n=1 Tax=Rhizobium sp. RU20A TaxID=1907412 RepID=UPI000956114F|nr:heme ABC transporter ATP-binding protein [Rhizobium sp. RU20A]SIQ30984.1 iron complex transport system ATP-binding protein [Rhizobium sp. RU20A]